MFGVFGKHNKNLSNNLILYVAIVLTKKKVCKFFADKKVRELLRSDVAKSCVINGVNILKDGLSFKYASPQITQYEENTTPPDSGHQHTRDEIQSLYKKQLITPEDFFEKSRNFAKESNGYTKAVTDEAKKYYLNKHGNIVGVIGQAGIGKTTLSKILLSRILSKKENLYNADYIFYVRLRDFENQNEIKLVDFLFKNITSDGVKIIDCSESFLNHLPDSDSVVIILDGFDEIDLSQLKGCSKLDFDMYGKNSPLKFILELLSGKVLPNAKKIITSRPRQLLDLSPDLKPLFIVSIVGIDNQGQKQICKTICKEQTQAVWDYLQNQPELKSYCHVPIMAILIFHSIYQIFQKSNQHIPTSITQVLAYILCLFFCTDHVHKNDTTKTDHTLNRDQTEFKLKALSKLSMLAYEGIVQKKNYLSEEDFQTAGLNENDISTIFITFHADDTSNPLALIQTKTKKLSYFSHLIWQEFFAAIHMIFNLKPENFAETCSDPKQIDLSNSHFEVVTKFLFGLCNEGSVEILKDIDDNYFHLPNLHASFLKKHFYSQSKIINTFSDSKHVFRIASLLYELGDKNLTHEFSNLLPSILRIQGDVFPQDILPFSKLLRERKHDLELHFTLDSSFHNNSNLLFLKEMESIISESLHIKVKIKLFLFFIILSIRASNKKNTL